MPLTIHDAQDAVLIAKLEVESWAEEFIREWMQPVIAVNQAKQVDQVLQFWDSLPPEAHVLMEQTDPRQHAQTMKKVEELRRKRGDNG